MSQILRFPAIPSEDELVVRGRLVNETCHKQIDNIGPITVTFPFEIGEQFHQGISSNVGKVKKQKTVLCEHLIKSSSQRNESPAMPVDSLLPLEVTWRGTNAPMEQIIPTNVTYVTVASPERRKCWTILIKPMA
nr:uncharacterized protein LOC128691947 [Cherax quadricarinatus]